MTVNANVRRYFKVCGNLVFVENTRRLLAQCLPEIGYRFKVNPEIKPSDSVIDEYYFYVSCVEA